MIAGSFSQLQELERLGSPQVPLPGTLQVLTSDGIAGLNRRADNLQDNRQGWKVYETAAIVQMPIAFTFYRPPTVQISE